MHGKISPSVMCMDFRHLEDIIKILEIAGVDYLHFDILDGNFVPIFTFGPVFLNAIREITSIPFDLHLMVQHPENILDIFNIKEGDIVSIHQESTIHLQRVLQKVKDYGAKPAVALNPSTPIYSIEDVLDDIDVILAMTVNPGFAGQKLIPAAIRKISKIREYLDSSGHSQIQIEVDGNVSIENALKMRNAGADIFVAGTSSLFAKNKDILTSAKELRMQIV